MQLNNALAQELHHQMHIYLQQLQELEDVLERERTSIANREFEVFSGLLETKNNLLSEIAHFDDGLTKLLKKALKKPTNESFGTLLSQYNGPLAQGLKLQWQSLQKTASQCKRANEVNSKIVSHAQQHYARLLSIFRKEDPDAATYSKTGRQTNSASSTGRLAKA